MKYISIDRAAVHDNMQRDEDKRKPVLIISHGLDDENPVKCFELEITKPCRLIYSPDRILKRDGTMVAIEAEDDSINIIR